MPRPTDPETNHRFVSGARLVCLPAMARGQRIQFKGATHHVMSRGNRKGIIFEDDADRRRFVERLGEATERYRLHCQSYCLMANHYHAIVEVPDGNLSDAMRWLNGVFARDSNRHHHRTGHLLQGRFKSTFVGDDIYLRTANLYVVMNPVRAGLVADPDEWMWSSYRATAGLVTPPDWLDLSWLNWVFGGRSIKDAQRRYREFQRVPSDGGAPEDMLVFGDESLRGIVGENIGETQYQSRVPREYKALGRPSLGALFAHPLPKAERNSRILRAHVVHGYPSTLPAFTASKNDCSISPPVTSVAPSRTPRRVAAQRRAPSRPRQQRTHG